MLVAILLLLLALDLPSVFGDLVSKDDENACFHISVLDADQDYSHANDVQYQGGYVFPALEKLLSAALNTTNGSSSSSSSLPPLHTILVDLPLTRWSVAVLQLSQPSAVVVHLNDSSSVRNRRVFKLLRRGCSAPPELSSTRTDQLCGAIFQQAKTFQLLRAAAAKWCRVDIPRLCDGSRSPLRVAVLSPDGHKPLVRATDLVLALQPLYKGRVDVVFRTTFEDADFCEQLRWFSDVDALIVGHEPSTINSVFLPPGAILVEATPRGAVEFCAYKAGLMNSGVRVQQVEASSKLTTNQPNMYRTLMAADVVDAIQAAGGLHKLCLQPSSGSTSRPPS